MPTRLHISLASITTRILSTLPGSRNTVSALAGDPVTLFPSAPQGCLHLLILLFLLATTRFSAAQQQDGLRQQQQSCMQNQTQGDFRSRQQDNLQQQQSSDPDQTPDGLQHQQPDSDPEQTPENRQQQNSVSNHTTDTFLQRQQDPIRNQMPYLIDTALIPFWRSTTMYNESVLMTAKEGGLPEAKLLFSPDKILSVRNSAMDITYREGVDWEYADGRLRLLKGSGATSLTVNQLFPDSSSGRSFPRKGGGFLLFSEGNFFHRHQLAVTYTHAANLWEGPVTSYQPKVFRKLLRKLKRGSNKSGTKSTYRPGHNYTATQQNSANAKFSQRSFPQQPELGHRSTKQRSAEKSGNKLTLLLFGDSIAEGYNGSKHTGAPPFLPVWGELVAEKLRRFYHAEIEFVNTAVAGMDSRWGVQTVEDRVIRHHPDLVIIAFGMNDGTAQMEADTFKANIRQIINRVKEQDSHTAFILVAPMLPNPRSTFEGTQRSFRQALQELTGNRIALVDMTGTHAELLEHKSYQDMTGNHINHPNDFLIRWYAQQVLSLLIPPLQL